MELFEWLSRSLGPGERLRLEIAREGESLSILVQPVFENRAVQSGRRAATTTRRPGPSQWLTGMPDQLDRELPEALRTYADRRQTLQVAASEWDALDDAIRRAQQAVQTQRQKAAQKTRVRHTGQPSRRRTSATRRRKGKARRTRPRRRSRRPPPPPTRIPV